MVLGALGLTACGSPAPRYDSDLKLNGESVSREQLDLGRRVYVANCVACHGASGDGKGPAVSPAGPHPRDFSSAEWATGEGPGADHRAVVEAIRRGAPAAGMPAWGALGDDKLEAVARYVEAFSLDRRTARSPRPR